MARRRRLRIGMGFPVRLSLPTKSALLTTSLVLTLLGLTAAWQHRQLSREYTALLGQQLKGLAQVAAEDLDYKIAMHVATLSREARRAGSAGLERRSVDPQFLAQSGLRPMFDGVALIATDGTILANDPPVPTSGLNIADRDYFRRARDGAPAISEPLHARTSGDAAILVAVPVRDARGSVVGVLGGGLNLHRPNVLGGLAAMRLSGDGYYLIETGGQSPVYVVHPDRARVLMPATTPVANAGAGAGAGDPGDLESSASIPTTGWTVRMVLPARAAYAPLARASQALLLQMLLFALVSCVLVWVGTVWIMRPFGTLHLAIQRLRRDPDAAVALDIRASDERGDLAREFDALMAELRTQRSEKAALTDASPIGLFRCDLDGRMVYVNDAYLAIHGLDREEASDGWLSLTRPESRELAWKQWRELVQKKTPFQLTRWIRRRDGRKVLISLQMRPMMSNEVVIGQVGTLADITDRTLAEQALRTLTAIFEMTTDYVVQLDKHGSLTYMNPAARQRTGVAEDEPLTRLTMENFTSPAALQRLRDVIVPTAVAKGVWVGESEIRGTHADDAFPVSHMVIAHRDKAGKIERFSAIMRDISEARATQRALFEGEARLRTMADVLPMRVAFVDAEQRYRFVNRAYERTFGVSRDLILGRTVRELFGDSFPTIEPNVERALRGEPVSFQRDVTGAAGYACFETLYIPQRGIDGRTITGFHALTTDVTRQKEEERRLLQLAHQDPLTGLTNRAGFDQALDLAMANARDSGRVVALLFVDLDRFKQVNDLLGHGIGDGLLRAVAARMFECVRSGDVVSRLGGDEFTVIVERVADAGAAAHVAGKIVEELGKPFVIEGRIVNVSASVGVAFYAGDATLPKQLIARADEMLYRAKAAGRNNCQLAEFPACACIS